MSTRFSRIRAEQPAPRDRFPAIASEMEMLERESDRHFAVMMALWQANQGLLNTRDLLIGSVVNRSLEVTDAFVSALDKWSVSVASALVRIQIDNVLRMNLFLVSPDVDAIYFHIAADKSLGGLSLPPELVEMLPEEKRRRNGLTHADWALVEIAAHNLGWIKDAYRTGSSWIHHSNAHLGITHRLADDDTFLGRVPPDIDQFDQEFLTGMCRVMNASTSAINQFIEIATEKKNHNPPPPDPSPTG